ncbi:hypothetical protein SAMN05660841_04326 [Sphingobacterium nematocida]|uniref:Acetolactate synthase n=1 Tax=Sphingobacterium nematocida TaxID=1513896 RepID=A0A1T5GSF5_9SPHI|nr:hypothetical protein [Sphingobacterium nematocida]SKC11337.1 hypothetical protein SAMN05660841_04326 [Sphingobacterium nematocida]
MTSKLFSISCNSSDETTAQLLKHISQKGYKVCTISKSLTDVKDVNLITIEIEIEGLYVDIFINEIQAIDGILDVSVSFGAVLQVATYQMKFDSESFKTLDILRSHNTQIINIEADKLLVLHVASEKDIKLLYNKLDNSSLLGFSQIPLAIVQQLPWGKLI